MMSVQPYSDSTANLAVYAAFTQPGDTVGEMALDAGAISPTARRVDPRKCFRACATGCAPTPDGSIWTRSGRWRCRSDRSCSGAGKAIPRIVDFAAFREIADEVERCWQPTSRTS